MLVTSKWDVLSGWMSVFETLVSPTHDEAESGDSGAQNTPV